MPSTQNYFTPFLYTEQITDANPKGDPYRDSLTSHANHFNINATMRGTEDSNALVLM